MNTNRTATARRHLNNFASFVRRQGLTGWTSRNAAGHYAEAFRAVLAVEDEQGIDAAAKLADRLTALRHEATAAGLLDAEDVCKAERIAVAA